MTNQSYVPAFPLNRYISYFGYSDGPAPYPREKMLPAPTMDLMVNFGEPFRIIDPDGKQSPILLTESWWSGMHSHYFILEFPAHCRVLSVGFKPGGASAFLRFPLSELQDQVVPLDALWGRLAAEIRERLCNLRTAAERFACLERLLLEHLCEPPPGWDAMQFAVNAIAQQGGILSIRALSSEIGMSQKHLISQFKRMVGISPKRLARVYRLQHLLPCINPAQPVDWAELAHQFAYHDQAHFSHDLKAFTGLAPGEYLQQRRRILESRPEHAEFLNHLAV